MPELKEVDGSNIATYYKHFYSVGFMSSSFWLIKGNEFRFPAVALHFGSDFD